MSVRGALAFAVAIVFGLGLVVAVGAQSPVTAAPAEPMPAWCGQLEQPVKPWGVHR